MNYLSLVFVAFVAVVFGLYNLFSQKHRWKVLLCASLFFYLCYDVKYLFFLMFVAISTFVTARFGRNKRRNKENLIICILANVGIWFVIKVFPWGINSINAIIERFLGDFRIPIPDFIVPVGISYYVLLAISYLVDVYRQKIVPEKNFTKYLLYLSYFPTIVQGPISRYEQLRETFTAGKQTDYKTFRSSLLLILIGLVKKMVIADQIAVLVNYCFNGFSELQGIILYIGAVGYSIQLYMDFSGCVDICRGVSALFGIELVDNFNGPYFSKSIKEFWGRWHISLSTWLKDYVYIPLGGNRKGRSRKFINLLLTFFASGIWHGSGLNYIVWGLLQGVYQIIGELSNGVRQKVKDVLGIKANSISDKVYKVLLTFHLTTFSWIFFRSQRLLYAVTYIRRMFGEPQMWKLFDGSLLVGGLTLIHFVVIIANIVFVVIIDYWKVKQKINIGDRVLNLHIGLRWICYFVLIFDVLLFGAYGSGYDMAGFLYGGF